MKEMFRHCLRFVTCVAFLSHTLLAHAGLNIPAGYQLSGVLSPPQGSFLGGIDYLSNGSLIYFDGTAVRKYTGTPPGDLLYDPPGTVFGSFVKVVSGTTIYFGESTDMKIYQIFTGGGGTYQATVQNNFDLENFGTELYISYNPTTYPHARVAKITLPGGTLDTIVGDTGGYCGPLALDASGSLYYCVPNPIFGQSPVTGLYRFSRAQVVSAFGPGELQLSDGQYLGNGLDGCYDMEYDNQLARLFVTTGNNFANQIQIYDTATGAVSLFASKTTGSWWSTYLRFRPGSKPFNPYNGPDAGVLTVVQNDTVYEIAPSQEQQPWTEANLVARPLHYEQPQVEVVAHSKALNRHIMVVMPMLLVFLLRPFIYKKKCSPENPKPYSSRKPNEKPGNDRLEAKEV